MRVLDLSGKHMGMQAEVEMDFGTIVGEIYSVGHYPMSTYLRLTYPHPTDKTKVKQWELQLDHDHEVRIKQ